MIPRTTLIAVAAALLLALPANAGGIYAKSSPVLQLDAKSYEDLIARSNFTSIIEFYAPWCGHCQNLKPAYEKAAKSLNGLAKVAAIDCDDESNKSFCGSMGVQGFPTLKIIKPSKKAGRPIVEDYQGPRSAKGIVDAVINKIPNHVKRIGDKGLDDWLAEANGTAKAVLFSEKGTTSALLKALSVEFLGAMSISQIRNTEASSVELFGISSFPTLIVLPGGDKDALVYEGEMKKEPLMAFLSQVASPNPDPAPRKAKTPKKSTKDTKKEQQKSANDASSFSSASSSQASAEASEEAAGATSIVLEEGSNPTKSPEPIATPEDAPAPVPLPDSPPPIPTLATPEGLQNACMGAKTSTCILALLPATGTTDEDAVAVLSDHAMLALASLAEISNKYAKRQAPIFPFYALPIANTGATELRSALGLEGDLSIEIIALNTRRTWWKLYDGNDYAMESVENFIDEIRLGEGKKEKLPDAAVLKIKGPAEHDEL
ncbi:MAG: hypothetical protein M1827_005492 [Pycnora praestabilis]|nr:MAG: hypothetical protein M1827_005492 [Pycnora praestabilis]